MKTKMKLFFFSMLMIFGMGNVIGQPNTTGNDNDPTREIAFMSDTGWVQGTWKNIPWLSDDNPNKSKWNYSFVNSIPGIGGDTVRMRLVDTSANHNVQPVLKWEFYETPSYTLVKTIYGDTVDFVLLDVVKPLQVYVYLGTDTAPENSINYMILSAKFSNPTPSIVSDTSGNKSPLVTKNDSITLSLSDFHVYAGQSYVGNIGKAYNDTITWFRDGIKEYSGTDTIRTFYLSGVYHVEIKNVFIPDTVNVIYEYSRWRISDTINVTIIADTTVTVLYLFDVESIFNVYPNPVAEYLYFSKETEYTVFSIAGKEITKGVGREIDVNDYDSGVYILSTPLGIKKFVVQ